MMARGKLTHRHIDTEMVRILQNFPRLPGRPNNLSGYTPQTGSEENTCEFGLVACGLPRLPTAGKRYNDRLHIQVTRPIRHRRALEFISCCRGTDSPPPRSRDQAPGSSNRTGGIFLTSPQLYFLNQPFPDGLQTAEFGFADTVALSVVRTIFR